MKTAMESGAQKFLPRAPAAASKLRVGYLSADFHGHATAWLIAEMIEKHDRSRYSVYGYSLGPDDQSPTRRRLVNAFDRFVDLRSVSFLQAAQWIAADDVQILVDLKGYTRESRTEILALRPAPVQVNYLGFPGTMGAPFMDYILVDDFIVPADQQPFFSERLVHLPGCYQVNDSRREISPCTPSRAECKLPEEGFVFCSFNNNYKITPEVFDVWMELLKRVEGSVLWLLEGNAFAPANLRREAESRGVASRRLVFAPRMPLPEHLARHRLADLFLDTFPVNAHTTASDALWAGCPVLTLAGETFVSRVAGSLLRTIGLPELITYSFDEYQAMALRLARNAELLAGLRGRLEVNRKTSRLFDAGRFARNTEEAYRTMWEIHVSGQPPRPFTVSDA
jgi:predicted O-linked N-acetylglucosamine transferase (SPINDLY family)